MSITYILSTLRRRWLTVLITLLLGTLAAASFAQAIPDRYAATASLVVTPVVSNPMTGNREDVNIRTEQEILGSREVARRAAESLGLPDDGGTALRADVAVAAPLGSQILEVTVEGDTPQQAADSANTIAAAYLELRRETSAKTTERHVEGVDQQIEELRAEPSTPAPDGLIESLQQQRSSVALTDPDPGQIIGSAVPLANPSGPGLGITLAGGAMAGLLLGVAVAVARERIDPRVRSADRLELSAGALSVVTERNSDEEFWVHLADEAIRRSRVDTDCKPVKVLFHSILPLPSQEVPEQFLAAARQILNDPGMGFSRSGEKKQAGKGPSSITGCVEIVQPGMYRASLTQAARRTDIAVVTTTPRASLKDTTDLISALRECGLEAVIGLLAEPSPPSITDYFLDKRSMTQPNHAQEKKDQELAVAPGAS